MELWGEIEERGLGQWQGMGIKMTEGKGRIED